jgi:hypothetical protein
MAQLSGDVDASGRAEIWPLLLEQAYAMMRGGYDNLETVGGFVGDAYTAFTGLTGSELKATDSMPDNESIVDAINAALVAQRQVVLNTRPGQGLLGSNLFGPHAYVVMSYSGTDTDGDSLDDFFEYVLSNPHGPDKSQGRIAVTRLKELVTSYEILQKLSPSP